MTDKIDIGEGHSGNGFWKKKYGRTTIPNRTIWKGESGKEHQGTGNMTNEVEAHKHIMITLKSKRSKRTYRAVENAKMKKGNPGNWNYEQPGNAIWHYDTWTPNTCVTVNVEQRAPETYEHGTLNKTRIKTYLCKYCLRKVELTNESLRREPIKGTCEHIWYGTSESRTRWQSRIRKWYMEMRYMETCTTETEQLGKWHMVKREKYSPKMNIMEHLHIF